MIKNFFQFRMFFGKSGFDRQDFSIGQGLDVHAFEDGDHVTLAGVKIPHTHGLKAHSDGDVVLHALSDALLGALALGDIGQHFPDTDPDFKGADSRVLLKHVYQLILDRGYVLNNADITIHLFSFISVVLYLNVRSDNNRLPWTQEEDAIISRYYEEKGAGYVHTLIPERSLQACKYRAMILGLSRKTNDPWTKAEEKILKKYYPVEGSNVYKRLNNRTRNACISKAAQLHLQYGLPMYKGPVLDEWIILAVKQGITKVRQSMTYSEITFKPGKLPELHLRLECDETGKFRVYEKSVLLDEKEYDRQRVENLADTMGLQIEGNKITLNSSEKEIEDDIFRLIAGCYLIYYLHYFMELP